jgi:hypothetical protein
MNKLLLRFREWIADHSSPQYPRPQVIIDPSRHQTQDRASWWAMFLMFIQAAAVGSMALLFAIPALFITGCALYLFFGMLKMLIFG